MKKEKIYSTIIITIVIVSLIPLLVLSFFNQPSADDFSLALYTYTEWKNSRSLIGVIQMALFTAIDFWHKWHGGYSVILFTSIPPSIFGEEYYFLTGFILIGTIIIANLYFSIFIFHECLKASKFESVTFGMLFSFLMIQYMPDGVEGIYWWDGAISYTFFFGLFMIWICTCIKINFKNENKLALIKVAYVSLFGLVIAGGNYVTAFMAILYLIGELIFFLLSQKAYLVKRNLPILLCVIGGFLLSALSPGTAVRQNALASRQPGVPLTIVKALVNGMEHIGDWLGVPIIVCCVVMLPYILKLVKNIYRETGFLFQYPLIVLILTFGWMCAMICPPIYAMGSMGEGRLTNIVYFSFIILVFLNVIYLCGWINVRMMLKGYEISNIEFSFNWWFTIFVLTIGMSLGTGRETACFEAIKELYTGEAQQYAKESEERWDLYKNSEGKDVIVEDFSVKPKLLFFDDVTDDISDENNYWINEVVSRYYGLNSVLKRKE